MGQLLTFQDQYQLGQELSHFSDDTITTRFKRDINTGCAKFMAALGRAYTRRSRSATLKAGQIYYQYPEDAFKIRRAVTHIGGIAYDLDEIVDEGLWNDLNQVSQTGLPVAYFVKGFDEVGIYPAYPSDLAAGLELIFTQRHLAMTQDDYTTGTVTVTQGSQTVTGTGTTFTSQMVGRAFEVSDGSDGNWYRITSVESTTSLTLENYYQGLSGSPSYRIGECAFIPEEYLTTPVDYALYRFYLGRDVAKMQEYKTLWDDATDQVRSLYSSRSDSAVIDASTQVPRYDSLRSNISIRTS